MVALTSTIPAVKIALVALLRAELDLPVDYAWPGPAAAPEAVFLGRHPQLDDIRIDGDSTIPTMKAGRKQRAEDYAVPVTCWTFRPELTAADAQTCEVRAFTIAAAVENVLADDPKLGVDGLVAAQVNDLTSTLFPFERGWACELVLDVRVQARLQ